MEDLVIVGAGPAGMAAAWNANNDRLKFRLLEGGAPGFFAATAADSLASVDHCLGFHGTSGTQLIDKFLEHLTLHGITIENMTVTTVHRTAGGFEISDGLKSYRTASLILATGTRPKEIGIANETSLTGNFLFPFCSNVGHRFIGRDVIVIGGRNAGAATALYLNRLGCRVLIVERDPQLNASEKYIELLNDQAIPRMTSTRVESVECEAEVVRVRLHTDKHIEELRAAALFNCTGFIPNNQLMLQLDLQVGQSGYVVVDEHMATSEPGVYAAGDVTGGVKQIPVAVAQGAIAEYNVNKLLKQQ